jgi:uncharacterized protein YggE
MKRLFVTFVAAASLVACSSGGAGTTSPALDSPPTSDVATPATTAAPESTDTTVVDPVSAETRSITVGGMGTEYAAPTRTIVDIGVSARRPSVAEASAAASAAGAALVAAFEEAGVPSSGIQTSSLWINPYFDPMMYQTVVGYEVSIGYNVVVPGVDSVGAVLGEAIQAGGDSVRASGIRFETEPTALMEAAREEAWTDVRARAEATADLAGEPLGVVLDVHEKVLVTSPQGMMQGGEGDTAAFDVPVAPGVAGVIVLLTVTYAIGE